MPITICPICGHERYTTGICNCECHPENSIPGQFKKETGGMTAEEFMCTVEFRRGS